MPTYSPYPEYYDSATPTPSPRGPAYYYATPQRPATRAHFRNASNGFNEYSPRPPTASPRYTSDGHYATANVSNGHHSRKASYSAPRSSKHRRRNSYSFARTSSPNGESDDEVIEIAEGVYYTLPADSRSRRTRHANHEYYYDDAAGYGTNYHYYMQGGYYQQYRDAGAFDTPRPTPRPSHSHARRPSMSTPQRPSTARPASSHSKKSTPAAAKAQATEADAKRHKIPQGYSLKNWDPSETPILLLGSVFDSNSLGKWIYDWTVYHHGPATPISDMAGELWLLLIQLAGKLKRAEECVGRVRNADNRETLEEFTDAGERLTEKLSKLLKACEQPMLKASKRKDSSLGKNSGVEFVETLFGRDRELEKTEKFMQNVRTFNLRFDANCEEILRNPTK